MTFEVAKMKQADNFGRTHSCYYSKKSEVAAKPAPKAKKLKKISSMVEADAPF